MNILGMVNKVKDLEEIMAKELKFVINKTLISVTPTKN